jgi:hypothetical protein
VCPRLSGCFIATGRDSPDRAQPAAGPPGAGAAPPPPPAPARHHRGPRALSTHGAFSWSLAPPRGVRARQNERTAVPGSGHPSTEPNAKNPHPSSLSVHLGVGLHAGRHPHRAHVDLGRSKQGGRLSCQLRGVAPGSCPRRLPARMDLSNVRHRQGRGQHGCGRESERASKQERRRETVRERGPPSLETKHIWAVEGCGCLAHRLLARLARRLLLGCALRHPPSLGLVLFHDLHDINHLQHASACTHVTATVTGTARARPPGSRLRASMSPARQWDGTDHTASRTSSRSSASTRDLDLRSTAMNYRPAR